MEVFNENSLVNLSNSILKHFGCDTFHDSIKEVDELLKGHKKVVVVLFDGMGKNIVRKHLKEKSFLRKHYALTINSTYPPTTAAATTSFLTGKYPIETGWLAWDTYFKDYDRNIILFRSVDFNTGETLIKENEQPIADKYLPTTKLFELIPNGKRGAKAYNISRFPIQNDGPKRLFKDGLSKLKEVLKSNEECFVYFYWDSPDREMHEHGINSVITHYQVKKAQRFIKKAVKQNPDTVFISIADHGHINVVFDDVCDHEDLYSLLSRPITLEKRTPSFFVNKENHKQFEELFNKYYGEHFELLTKEEVLSIKLFGDGTPMKGAEDYFGDFVAIAKDEHSLYASKELSFIDNFKGHHAGGTKEEREIDVSIFNI